MTLKFNPFTMVEHNGAARKLFMRSTLPRFVFLGGHWLLGVIALLITWLASKAAHAVGYWPGLHLWDALAPLYPFAMAFALEFFFKSSGVNWRGLDAWPHTTTHGFGSHEPWDLASDFLLALLGAALPIAFAGGWHLVGYGVAFYLLTTFNGT